MGFKTSKYMTGMKKSANFKALSVAALAGVAGFASIGVAQATEIDFQAPEPINISLPTPTHGENAAYTLTEISAPTDTSITMYEVINNVAKPHYYEYSIKDGASVGTYRDAFGTVEGDSNLNRDFIGNSSNSVFTDQNIDKINGDFLNNKSTVVHVYNGKLNTISGSFIGNTGNSVYVNYRPTVDDGIILNINATFMGNKESAITANYGGRVESIDSVFVGNTAQYGAGVSIYDIYEMATGGASFGDIKGDFISNSATYSGGAISIFSNYKGASSIDSIDANFVGNQAGTDGGAISLIDNAYVGTVSGNFVANKVLSSANGSASGGAISLSSTYQGPPTIDMISANFFDNYAYSKDKNAYGGAISANGINPGRFALSNSVFKNNYAISDNGNAYGGAIYSAGEITQVEKKTEGYGYNNIGKGVVNTSFVNNYAKAPQGEAQGGAILAYSPFEMVAQDGYTSIISGNYVEDKNGIRPEGIRINSAGSTDVVVTDEMVLIPGDPSFGIADRMGNVKERVIKPNLSLITNTNGKFVINDQLVGMLSDQEVKVGKFYTYLDIAGGGWERDAYLDEDLNVIENPKTVKASTILSVSGDGTGLVQLNNDVIDMDVWLDNSTLHLGARDNVLNNNNLTLKSGIFSMLNNQVGISALNSLTVTGDTNFVADVDLASQTMDRFTANEYGEHQGNLNVVGMNLLSDAPADRNKTEIYFAQPGLKDKVVNGTGELPDSKYQTVAYTPIYKYNVSYDNREDAGYFVFDRGAQISGGGNSGTSAPSNPSTMFNPAVLATPVTSQAAGQATVTEAFKYVFEHADAFTQFPESYRLTKMNENKYALSTDYNENLGSFHYDETNKGVWLRPYTTFEEIDFRNGPEVDTVNYGTLIGYDGNFKEMRNGWHRLGTTYLGYNGSQVNYSNVDTTMNGGLIGVTETFYKGNFWSALTASVGASVGETRTMYGKEDFTTLLAGVGSKTGYNFEFKEGKYIVQPIWYMSYTFVNTFDYTNAAGVKIDTDPNHTIQLHPSIRVVGNMKNGWQPYAQVGMVWNLLNESSTTANGVKLPDMKTKPYVEYGVGIQKHIKDDFTAFGQAMVRNGGRTGVALTAGFRWALGHDCKYKNQKVDAKKQDKISSSNEILRSAQNDRGKCIGHPEEGEQRMKAKAHLFNASRTEGSLTNLAKDSSRVSHVQNDRGRKILKQMTPAQRAAYGGKYQNTSRTAKSGSLRQY